MVKSQPVKHFLETQICEYASISIWSGKDRGWRWVSYKWNPIWKKKPVVTRGLRGLSGMTSSISKSSGQVSPYFGSLKDGFKWSISASTQDIWVGNINFNWSTQLISAHQQWEDSFYLDVTVISHDPNTADFQQPNTLQIDTKIHEIDFQKIFEDHERFIINFAWLLFLRSLFGVSVLW